MTPILDNKDPAAPSVFRPAALLREARRQKGLATIDVPAICILDPDGDIVRRLRRAGRARPFEGWPCYHTALDTFTLAGQTVGIVGSVVGAPFAVLVAEELFASGCRFLLSLTSAGQITPAGPPPYFVIIDRALRDEGTSYHYAAPSAYGEADTRLVATNGNFWAALRGYVTAHRLGPFHDAGPPRRDRRRHGTRLPPALPPALPEPLLGAAPRRLRAGGPAAQRPAPVRCRTCARCSSGWPATPG